MCVLALRANFWVFSYLLTEAGKVFMVGGILCLRNLLEGKVVPLG